MVRSAAPRLGAGTSIISLKVTLRETKPPIWRRLLIQGTMTLGELHQAIQAAMGWHDCHLHGFEIDGRQYGDREAGDDFADENRLTLNGLIKSGVTRFPYIYDFGDNWEHTVAIEKTLPATDGGTYPVRVAGRRACPPEDCGGPWGYQALLEILADPAHPEHAERLEWLDDDLTPDQFDTADANARLARHFPKK